MKEIIIEDVLSVVITTEDVSVMEFVRFNKLKEELRNYGILCDMGSREIETARRYYPNNIITCQDKIQIIRTQDFERKMKARVGRMNSDDINLIKSFFESTL